MSSRREQPLRVADLFCGAGGLSQGFKDAGFEIAFGLDRDRDSTDTFALNHPGAVVMRESITKLTPDEVVEAAGHVDVLVGGPSCQGFSTAGRLGRGARGSDPATPRWVRPGDVRNDLWKHFLAVVEKMRPRAFLIENVPGLVHWQAGTLGATVLKAFETLGYAVDLRILLAADFGVPQRRRRLFVVGFLEGNPFRWPRETHMGGWRRDTLHLWEEKRRAEQLLSHVTCWETIRDLPPLDGGTGAREMRYGRPSTSAVSASLRRRGRVLFDHEAPLLGDEHLRLIRHVPRGGTWRDIPPHLLPERFRGMRRTDSTNLYGRLDPSLPAYTISTQFTNPSAGCFVHPYEDRVLTVREGARLQTFPDTYRFVGPMTSKCRQIGNAVPPLLATVLADAVADQLLGNRKPAWRRVGRPLKPAYAPPSEQTRLRMKKQRRSDTGPEVAVRRLLYARGLRFRKEFSVLGDRRTVDIAFPAQRVAVFIDGCFWHGCPEHERPTKSNTLWWREKIDNNKRRDAATTADLQLAGWVALRCWEHDAPEVIADWVEQLVLERRVA